MKHIFEGGSLNTMSLTQKTARDTDWALMTQPRPAITLTGRDGTLVNMPDVIEGIAGDKAQGLDGKIAEALLRDPLVARKISSPLRSLYNGPVEITEETFTVLIGLLKGNVILIDGEETFVDDDAEVRPYVSTDLHIGTTNETGSILWIGDRGFLTGRKDERKTIAAITGDRARHELLKFFDGQRGMSPDEASENLYRLFRNSSDLISFAPEAHSFLFEEKIRLDFWLDRRVVFYELSVTLAGEPVSSSHIIPSSVADSIGKLKEYLSDTGFDDECRLAPSKLNEFIRSDLSSLRELAEVRISDKLSALSSIVMSRKKSGPGRYEEPEFVMNYQISEQELKEVAELFRGIEKTFSVLTGDRILDGESEEQKYIASLFSALVNKTVLQVSGNFRTADFVNAVNSICRAMITDAGCPIVTPSNGSYRRHQEYGIRWILACFRAGVGSILADDMGLGKTLQTLAAIFSAEGDSPSLIVTPSHLSDNWLRDAKKFFPEKKIIMITGEPSARKRIISSIDWKQSVVYLTTYDMLDKDLALWNEAFAAGHELKFLAVDEAHNVNTDNVRYKALSSIRSRGRILLTGTPIENNVDELWRLLSLVRPGWFGDRNAFRKLSRDEQHSISCPFILRRVKESILDDFPKKQEETLCVVMDRSQEAAYAAAVGEYRDAVRDKSGCDTSSFNMKLRLISSCPATVGNISAANAIRRLGTGSKFGWLKGTLPGMIKEGHRLLVFSNFTSTLNHMERLLDEIKVAHVRIDGDVDAVKRPAICKTFNEDPGQSVMLLSYGAGSEGLNLQGADTVILLDPTWTPSIEDQAISRAHRLGQKRPVRIIRLVTKGSVEEYMMSVQAEKRGTVSSLVQEQVPLAEIEKLLAGKSRKVIDRLNEDTQWKAPHSDGWIESTEWKNANMVSVQYSRSVKGLKKNAVFAGYLRKIWSMGSLTYWTLEDPESGVTVRINAPAKFSGKDLRSITSDRNVLKDDKVWVEALGSVTASEKYGVVLDSNVIGMRIVTGCGSASKGRKSLNTVSFESTFRSAIKGENGVVGMTDPSRKALPLPVVFPEGPVKTDLSAGTMVTVKGRFANQDGRTIIEASPLEKRDRKYA